MSDERGFLAGTIVAEVTSERFVIQVNDLTKNKILYQREMGWLVESISTMTTVIIFLKKVTNLDSAHSYSDISDILFKVPRCHLLWIRILLVTLMNPDRDPKTYCNIFSYKKTDR